MQVAGCSLTSRHAPSWCRAAAGQPGRTFYSTKRLIGRKLSTVSHAAQKVP